MEKRLLIEPYHPEISIAKQCELLEISRSGYYYEPRPETEENMHYMLLLDKQYMKTPFYGVRRMHCYLRSLGYRVNMKRVRRLLRLMGLEAIYPKPRTSQASIEYKIYPYLLNALEIQSANQVWCADITYIPMTYGFMYLIAIMDWFSRFVLVWEISNSLETYFCLEALERALSSGKPSILQL